MPKEYNGFVMVVLIQVNQLMLVPLNQELAIYNLWNLKVFTKHHLLINTQDLTVIPNPFESSCEVSFNSQKGLNLEISLNDVMGRSVITHQITTTQGLNKITLDNLDLPSGVYHISVKFPDKVLTKQVMIIR